MKGKFKFQEGNTYRMPVHFCGYPYNADNRPVFDDCLMLSVDQLTDMEALAKLIPEEFEILEPIVSWSYSNCRGVSFMSNGEYIIFQATVPVKHKGITGVYPLVIWEDNPVPIIGGREEDGMPKLFCNISPERHYENHWFAAAALNCETIAHIDFFESEEVVADSEGVLVNNFGYRYIPLVGSGGAATSGVILYPQEASVQQKWLGKGEVRIFPPRNWYENPSIYSILKSLSELPNLGFTNALRQKSRIRLCVADSAAMDAIRKGDID